jgi:hypothetical protein
VDDTFGALLVKIGRLVRVGYDVGLRHAHDFAWHREFEVKWGSATCEESQDEVGKRIVVMTASRETRECCGGRQQ